MCHAAASRPPALPAHLGLPRLAGGAGAERLTVTSADGTAVPLALAETPAPRGPAVVLLPDLRGLAPFYDELAERFATAGHHTVVVDYFGRTDPFPRGDDFDPFAATKATRLPQIHADIAAATALLRERTGASSVVVVGFCFGGSMTYLSAADDALDFDGFVAFYGGLSGERFGFPDPPDHAADMRGPILGLFGGADDHIPAASVAAFDAGLTAAGVQHEFVTYPGAPHSFFDRTFEEHADACADAWERVLAFLGTAGAAARPA